MKNIFILPTDKPSRLHLWIDQNGSRLELCELEYSHTRNTQNIYITSNEEVNHGDYAIRLDLNVIFQVHEHGKPFPNYVKKIVLTNDTEAIEDGVQAIDNEFLEWFVKNPNCNFVETLKVPYFDESNHSYLLIIPKEEDFELVSIGEEIIKLAIPMIQDKEEFKQETLEEATFTSIENEIIKEAKKIWEESHPNPIEMALFGAKWQAERMYSEEDLYKAFEAGHDSARLKGSYKSNGTFKEDFCKWFEQFKKK